MTKSIKTLMLTAAVSGLLGGATVRAQARSTNDTGLNPSTVKSSLLKASLADQDDKDKHACKGQNDLQG